MSKLIDIASAEIGTKEVEGRKHNQRIIQYAHEAGFDWVNSDETPWCSIFLNWVTHKAGYSRSKDARSKSWKMVGDAVSEPQPGDVILFGSKGNIHAIYHVGIFTGFSEDGRKIFCLGGNQTDAVSISKMWRSEVAGYRRLEPIGTVIDVTQKEPEHQIEQVSNSTKVVVEQKKELTPISKSSAIYIYGIRLRSGHTGEEVECLQKALNQAGYNCGEADGIFGDQTRKAVILLQLDAGIRTTGKVNYRTRRYLAKMLNIEVKPKSFASRLRHRLFGRRK